MFDPISRRAALQRVGLLLGGALSAPTLSAVLAGCRAEVPASGYAFKALDADGQRLLGTLVDLILPATDTPGAKAAGVDTFIDKLLADWMKDEDRTRFLTGLADVDARAHAAHQQRFVDLDAARQTALLTALDRAAYAPPPPEPTPAERARAERAQSGQAAMDEAEEAAVGADTAQAKPAPPPAAPPTPFFRTLKELTLAGYYTSEVGATQELQYGMMVGRYDADVPLSDIGRAWA